MKLLTAILLLISSNLFAINYYVSDAGNDSNNGLTTGASWKTISKVNSFTFGSGDSILFKCGDTFYGTIAINRSNLNFGLYGTGAKPIISGFTNVTAWTNLGGNIWESTSAVSTLNTCNMVVINEINTPVGRTPNTGYYTIASHVLKTSLTSASLNVGTNWTGAEAVIKTSDWTINRTTITSQASNLINIDGTQLFYNILDGYGFFLQKDIRTLDSVNEWYFNPSTKKIYIYSVGSPTTVKVATVENLFVLNASNITLQDIAFEGANGSAIFRNTTLAATSNFSIKNCNINYSGLCAIELKVNTLLINNNIITNSNDHALYVSPCKNVTITNNVIRNSGTLPGMGTNGHAFSAVTIGNSLDSRSTVTNNTIINTGHNPITFGVDTSFIAYNRIDSFNTVIDDGGGIYGGKNGTVVSNIVSNGIGNWEGTARSIGSTLVVGIYIDDLGERNTINDNVIFNINWIGMYLHSASFNDVNRNTIYNSKSTQFLIKSDAATGSTRNNNVKNNIFVSREANQVVAQFRSQWNDLDTIGTLDSNIYARPILDVNTIAINSPGLGALVSTLEYWKSLFGKDPNSKKASKTITNVNELDFQYNATASPIIYNFSGVSKISVDSVVYNNSVTIPAYSSVVLLANGTAPLPGKRLLLRRIN